MKRLCKNIFAAAAALAIAGGMTGCAHDHHDRDHHHRRHRHGHSHGMGAAPGGVTGSAQGGTSGNSVAGRDRGAEPVRTESVLAGVGSALFPNPEGP